MECSHDMQIEHAGLLAKHNSEIEAMKVTLADFSTIKETLVRLAMISEQSLEFNRTQSRSNEKVEKALFGINENLNQLNSKVKNLEKHDCDHDTNATETRVEDKRVQSERLRAQWSFWGIVVTGSFLIIKTILELIFQ